MYFYKNVIDEEIVGYTYSYSQLNVEDFQEISQEEWIASGNEMPKRVEKETKKVDFEQVINAIIQ